MKRQLMLAAMFVAAPAAAHAQTYVEGYVGAAAGPTFKSENFSTFVPGAGLVSGQADLDFKTAVTAGAEIGTNQFADGNIRVGASWDFMKLELDSATATATAGGVTRTVEIPASQFAASGSDLDANVNLVQAQLYYNFPLIGSSVRPFVGAGVGAAFIEGSDTEFAASATAGARIKLTDTTYLSMRYRYAHVNGIEDDGITFEGAGTHSASVGFGILF